MCFMLLAGLGGCSSPDEPPSGNEIPAPGQASAFEQPAPRAACGGSDLVETDIQGRVPQEDRVSGRSMFGYNCNLELVGQFDNYGQGASWQMAWQDDCAYFDTNQATGAGTMVIDGSDSTAPVLAGQLTTPAMLYPHESLTANERRGLLAGVGFANNALDVYDVKSDCRKPQLMSSTAIYATARGHEGGFSRDGLTFYGTANSTGDGSVQVYDISDPTAPEGLLYWLPPEGGLAHGLSTSEDGTRGYFALSPQRFAVVDLSDVQSRKANPQIRIISTVLAYGGGQHTRSLRIGGAPFVLAVDEGVGPRPGIAALFDMSDDANPKLVSRLMLEVHTDDNALRYWSDNLGSNSTFGYNTHYCTEDDATNTTAIACSFFMSGIRVFDVRDPYHPREIAYYNPPARPGARVASSVGNGQCGNVDWATANSRFRADRGELWISTQCNGFQILKFTNDAWPFF